MMTAFLFLAIIGVCLGSFFIIRNSRKKKNQQPAADGHQKPTDHQKPSDVDGIQKPADSQPKPADGHSDSAGDKPDNQGQQDQQTQTNLDREEVYKANTYYYIEKFGISVRRDGATFKYLLELFREAYSQFYTMCSAHGLPALYVEENFPKIYDFYGYEGDKDSAFRTLIGWLFALQLAELRPFDRTSIFKTGYEFGGYDKNSNIYGYRWMLDPNDCRLVAAAIYSMMRGFMKPDISAMRTEMSTPDMPISVSRAREEDPFAVGIYDFYTDLREFLPTAPGPYAPGYEDRSAIGGEPYPDEARTDDCNLAIDRLVYEVAVSKYNLGGDYNDPVFEQETVQAIADKDCHVEHLFGTQRISGRYTFDPAFTSAVLGQLVYPSLAKPLCSFIDDIQNVCSSQRCIMQGHERQMDPWQYGRLRPGCSWQQEARRHSYTDPNRNVLVDFDIEEHDGHPTDYYNEDGEWIEKEGIHSPEEYNDKMQDELWANSYPSGHSAAIMGAALALMELLPMQAANLLYAANRYALHRSVARFHWLSDTRIGRVLAGCAYTMLHNCTDFERRQQQAGECLEYKPF